VLDLLTVGEAFDDFVFHGLRRLPREGEELKTNAFAQTTGGGVVITAIAAARLGLRCGAMTGVSEAGAQTLRGERVRVFNLRRRGEPAALSVALSTPRDRAFVTFPGINDVLPDRIRKSMGPVRARHVHFAFRPAPAHPWIDIVDALRRRGTTTSWDFGWNPDLARDSDFDTLARSVDYLFVNRDEAVAYSRTRTIAAALARWRCAPRHVVVKLGSDGAVVVGATTDVRAPAFRTRVADTTGAGDAFNAGFLAAVIRGGDAAAGLILGNRLGALSIRHPGGLAGLPARGSIRLRRS